MGAKKSKPVQASKEKSKPVQVSKEKSKPVQASKEKSKPVQAREEKSKPVQASKAKEIQVSLDNEDKRGIRNHETYVLLLTHGYIRKIEQTSLLCVPTSLIDTVRAFYDNTVEYKGKFIASNAHAAIKIVNDYEIVLSSDGYKSAKLDAAIPMNQTCVVHWGISITHDHNGHDIAAVDLDNCDFIGVVSDQCDNIGRAPWGNLIDCYGISGRAPYVFLGTNDDFVEDDNYETTLKRDEIVTVQLWTLERTLKFYARDSLIYSVILPQRAAWFPAVSVAYGAWNYGCTLHAL